jgi:superfamily II helicase
MTSTATTADELFVNELFDEEGDILFDVMFRGRSIASTYSRRQLDDLLDAVNRPVRWVVPV